MLTPHPERRESGAHRREVLAEEEFFPLTAARAKRHELAVSPERIPLPVSEHEAAMKMWWNR
jgi:hypothetical protein